MKKSIFTTFVYSFVSLISFGQNIPIDFEASGNGANWTWTVFENSSNPPPLEIVTNPFPIGINPSSKVAKFTALQTGNPWAGCESQHGADIGPFTISASNKIIRILVYKTVISNVGIKLVNATGASLGEILVANTKINEWEQLTFDFTSHIGNGYTYDQIVIFPDFIARSADDVIYFDNIWGSEVALGLEENSSLEFSIHPNLAHNALIIDAEKSFESIRILDLNGREVFQAIVNEKHIEVNSSFFRKGYYFVQIVSESGSVARKFLVD